MIRTFNSIGQGGFYTERFQNHNVVFECGSDTDVEIIKKSINDQFEKDEKIDAVFISHLHSDHINGLEYLLRRCKVERIFLPYVSAKGKAILLIREYIYGKDNEFCSKFISNPQETVGETKIIYVKQEVKEDNQEGKEDKQDNEVNLYECHEVIDSGTKIIINGLKKWVFQTYNFEEVRRAKNFEDNLKKIGIKIQGIKDVEKFWKTEKDNLIKAYKNVRGDLNTNSMVVYSGAKYNINMFMIRCCNSCRLEIRKYRKIKLYCKPKEFSCIRKTKNNRVGCLYLGDYDAKGKRKFEEIKSKYSWCWNMIGIVQIPHHGSMYNFNKDLLIYDEMECIISAGFINKYKHPSKNVLQQVYSKGCKLQVVNEYIQTQKEYRIFGID